MTVLFLHTFRLPGEALAERTKSRHTQANASEWLCVQCAMCMSMNVCVTDISVFRFLCFQKQSSPSQQNHCDQLKMKKSTEFITLSVRVCEPNGRTRIGLDENGHCRIAQARTHIQFESWNASYLVPFWFEQFNCVPFDTFRRFKRATKKQICCVVTLLKNCLNERKKSSNSKRVQNKRKQNAADELRLHFVFSFSGWRLWN